MGGASPLRTVSHPHQANARAEVALSTGEAPEVRAIFNPPASDGVTRAAAVPSHAPWESAGGDHDHDPNPRLAGLAAFRQQLCAGS